jgi:putative flippase GtrA
VVNKLYVFNSRNMETKTVGKEAASFTIGRILTGLVAIIGFPILYNLGLNQKLFGVDGFVAKITVSVLEILLNYLFSKYLVFNHKDKE